MRGFENRCAHRSFPLRTADRGKGPIVCGFHHWRYDSEGHAVDIPHCRELFGATPKDMAAVLAPIEVATCGSLVFGRFRAAGDSETLEQFLGEGFPILKALSIARARPQLLKRQVEANWRLCFQISVEDYHIVAVHPRTFGKNGYLKRRNIGYFRFGRHSAFFTRSEPDAFARMAAECRQGTWRSVNYRVFHIFPNLTLSHFRADGQHWYMLVLQYAPVAIDRSAMRAWLYPAPFPPAEEPRHLRWTDPLTDPLRRWVVPYYVKRVLREDNGVCERLQEVAHQIKDAPVLGGLEERLDWFEQGYAEVMQAR